MCHFVFIFYYQKKYMYLTMHHISAKARVSLSILYLDAFFVFQMVDKQIKTNILFNFLFNFNIGSSIILSFGGIMKCRTYLDIFYYLFSPKNVEIFLESRELFELRSFCIAFHFQVKQLRHIYLNDKNVRLKSFSS